MLVWKTVTSSSRIIAEAYDPEARRIFVRFADCVEWSFADCSLQVWNEFTAPGQSRGTYIADVLEAKPNGPRVQDVQVRRVERIGQLTGSTSFDNVGKTFFLPNDEEGSSLLGGQKGWRFCTRCHGLCFSEDLRPGGACPAGGKHNPAGFNFSLPNQPSDPDQFKVGEAPGTRPSTGQPEWRFCIYCLGLFWSGSAFKGLCPGAPGGGFHLHAVARNAGKFVNKFAPLNAEDPIGHTQLFETPSGAFSHDGRVYVFAGIAPACFSNKARPGDPACGLYLISTDDPRSPGTMLSDDRFTPTYRKEFLVSPRIGCCPKDDSRLLLESHQILGHRFVLQSEPGGTIADVKHWRLCTQCESMAATRRMTAS
jgi:hypothetical protein